MSLEHGTEEALQDWLDTVGDTRIQHARGQSKLPKLPEVHGWKAAKEKDPARGRLLAFSRAVNT